MFFAITLAANILGRALFVAGTPTVADLCGVVFVAVTPVVSDSDVGLFDTVTPTAGT